MLKLKKIISFFLCTLVITASFLALSGVKTEAATGYCQSYAPGLNFQYLKPFGTNVNSNFRYNLQYHPLLEQELVPTVPETPITPTATDRSSDQTTLTSGLTTEEQQMVDLVNQERVNSGLQPLEVDLRLVKIARMKSQDMIDNNYFSHQSPTYGSPFDMMKSQGIAYGYAGENLAGNHSVQAAHTALMDSPGHRANILNANFKHVGIGIVSGGPYGMMFTQEFTD